MLSQNPLSEPDLTIKLWNFVLEYKNRFLKESKKENNLFIDDNLLDVISGNLKNLNKFDTDINELLHCFIHLKLKSGYLLDYINFGHSVCVYARGVKHKKLSYDDYYCKFEEQNLDENDTKCEFLNFSPFINAIDIEQSINGYFEFILFMLSFPNYWPDADIVIGNSINDFVEFCNTSGKWVFSQSEIKKIKRINCKPFVTLTSSNELEFHIFMANIYVGVYWQTFKLDFKHNLLISVDKTVVVPHKGIIFL